MTTRNPRAGSRRRTAATTRAAIATSTADQPRPGDRIREVGDPGDERLDAVFHATIVAYPQPHLRYTTKPKEETPWTHQTPRC